MSDGEAQYQGVQLNDRIVSVADKSTKSYQEVVEAIRAHRARPLVLSLERREKRNESMPGPGIVNFRLDEEIDKAERILKLMIASPKSGPPSDVVRNARGLAFLRVTKLGFGTSVRFGSGLVIARLSDAGWSAPSAIGTVGVSMGFQLGTVPHVNSIV